MGIPFIIGFLIVAFIHDLLSDVEITRLEADPGSKDTRINTAYPIKLKWGAKDSAWLPFMRRSHSWETSVQAPLGAPAVQHDMGTSSSQYFGGDVTLTTQWADSGDMRIMEFLWIDGRSVLSAYDTVKVH